MSKAPFYDCPRYSKCDVNNCPLHAGYPDLYVDPCDSAQKCTLAKTIRARIAAGYPGILKYEGLTPREHQAKIRWDNMTPDERQKVREMGINTRFSKANEHTGIETPYISSRHLSTATKQEIFTADHKTNDIQVGDDHARIH